MYKSEAEDLFDQLPRIAAPEHVKPITVTGSDSGHYVIASIDGGTPQVLVSIEQVYEILAHLDVKPLNAAPPAPAAAATPTVAELETQLAAAKLAAAPSVTAVQDPTTVEESVEPGPPAFGDVVDPNTGHAPVPVPVAAPAAFSPGVGVITPAPAEAPQNAAEPIPPTTDPNTGQVVPIPTPEAPAS